MQTDILELLKKNAADDRAWTALYLQLRPWVYAVCFKWLGHFDDAEDATQQTFIHLATHWRQLDFAGWAQLQSYLKRIAISRSIDLLRRRKSLGPTVDPHEPTSEPVSLRPDVRDAQTIDELPELLGLSDLQWSRLSRRQQQVLWLSYLGHSRQEIVDQLGISERTVRRDLHGLRRLLR